MELLDTDDPIKGELLMKTARHREELEQETRAIADRTEKIITNAIVIGGALALTYFLYTQISGSKKKKSKKKAENDAGVEEETETPSVASNMLSEVGSALVAQGGALLLSLAKEKLTEYLRAQADKNQPS
ncbi:MAG TPA: hypothetical protein PK325_01540 [Cyclobacteriaceae bacterium]|nr:hypothetical protein [Cyclobacteriaceae bacterium]HMV08048.1 hypothetical protein [Cyclobacteriaceae bacterium]HMV88264.1 hypothetical protein [Cyclobacteriaceae bacterium]HMX00688.1 hypothetical protein [Cyclobacteriaceae bacterium]HMX49437.1 hypothetical protein [Cyclobacteriaceae bacterium]